MGTYEVRWRKKGKKVWHHDRIKGKKNIYYKGTKKYGGGYVEQKKFAHRTLRGMDEVAKRQKQLKNKHGDDIEFFIKHWGAGYRH